MTAEALTQPALKEWSAAVHAMLDGRQTVLLRKGGIHEKRFTLDSPHFVFFPTVAHSHAQRVRPEHRDLLAAAAADSTEAEIVLRAGAKVVAAVEVNRPERLEDIAPMHIWTAESVRADRLDFRPRHKLTALVVQVSPLAEPERVARVPGVCRVYELGAAAGQSDVVDAGPRRRDAARYRCARSRFSGVTAGRPQAAAAATRRPRRARCGWPAASVCR